MPGLSLNVVCQLLKMTQHWFSWNSHFPPSAGFITNYLIRALSTTSTVQIKQMQRQIWWPSSSKLFCKSFQEFYAPFLLNSFLEHVPILHICSFFLLPTLVPRSPVYLFSQSGYCFSLGGGPSFALSTWSFE